jgi:multicomponent Na+:H+ antiporter subunit A
MAGFPPAAVVFGAVALPFVAAGAAPVVHRLAGERTGYVAAAVALGCFGLLGSLHGTTGTVAVEWVPALGVALRFHVDGWGLLFALLASGMGVLVFVYSAAYMHGEARLARYYATLLAFMGSIVGVALAGDLLALFLFWELTSVCSFVLIGHYSGDPDARYAARMAMVVTVGGGLVLLVGFLLLALAAGGALGARTFDLVAMLENADAMRAALRETHLFVPVLLLVAVGAGAKSAQVPLHFWLPNAMAAPTPVSAFLHSATMVKVGVYLVGRLRPLLLGPEWVLLFASVGLATMLVTAALAVASSDVKELLAYSTASHLGLMVAGFGFAAAVGAEAGVFHLLNHALFKAALFLVAGVLAHQAGTRRLDELGGLRRDLPLTALVAGVAALSMAGLPPFNGFYSKELLFEAAWEASHGLGPFGWLYPAAATLASVFTVLYSLRFLGAFFGDKPAALGDVTRPSPVLLGPPALLAALAAAVGAAPQLAVDALVQGSVAPTAVEAHEMHAGLPTSLSPPVAMTAVALAGGAAAYPFYDRIQRGVRTGVAALSPARPSWWYDRTVGGLTRASTTVTPRVHDGLLRTYATWLVAATTALALGGYAAATVRVPTVDLGGIALVVAVVLVVAAVTTVAVPAAPSHVAGVLTISLLGFMVAIFFVLASAPDLALTQLVVETLALLIFLLVLEEVPEYYGDVDVASTLRDAVLSVGIGLTVALTVLLAGRDPGEQTTLARYFVRNAVPEGGGTNVVNVVLVDFRAFDTLGEIVVLALAAVSVLTLVAMRRRGETP